MAMEDEDDPFVCFGGDEDEDDDDIDPFSLDAQPSNNDNVRVIPPSSAIDAANREKARQLMESYATKKSAVAHDTKSHTANNDDSTFISTEFRFFSSRRDQKERTSALPWPQRPPLYLGPMAMSSSLAEGGGRGYVALRDLPPGTCVLIEEPYVEGWSEGQMGKELGLESIRHLLRLGGGSGKRAGEVLGALEELHPRREKVEEVFAVLNELGTTGGGNGDVDGVEPLDRIQIVNMMKDMEGDFNHVNEVQSLLAMAKEENITNSDGSPLNSRDINRLLLALRYNGFESGIYLHFSMFNHDEDPNCIKFRPSLEEGNETKVNNSDDNARKLPHYSEARTTRYVRKGEALTLHYLENPREVSHATRRKILWDQHRFDIGVENAYRKFLHLPDDVTFNGISDDDVGGTKDYDYDDQTNRRRAIYASELVNGEFPDSSLEEHKAMGTINNTTNSNNGNSKDQDEEEDVTVTSNIEKSLDDLEEMLQELQHIFQNTKGALNQALPSSGAFERAAALELTFGELVTASRSSLGNDHHILLSRCRRMHLDSIELVLSKCSDFLTEKQSVELMARFLPTVQMLLESQKRRLGSHHTHVAATYHDFSMGIQSLLSLSSRRLLSLKLEGMGSLEECSMMELYCRREKERIERLYPRDVEEILEMVK
mmetsp:Transcript_7909/g.16483  ORF Transcript_7909/g.16483 Transcript_7909/m.16483 type:complete len:657 (+) Transcript_7909:103-2073(+)